MNEIEIPQFDEEKLKKNGAFKRDALEGILLHLIFYFNDNLKGFVEFQKGSDIQKIIGQGIVFNFYIIGRLLKTLGIGTPNIDVKNLRDCIAHFEERIKLYYNSDKEVAKAEFSSGNIKYTKDGGVVISDLNLSGAHLTTNSDTKKNTISSPFGVINNDLIGLDQKGKTIVITLNEDLFELYKGEIENVLDKYKSL